MAGPLGFITKYLKGMHGFRKRAFLVVLRGSFAKYFKGMVSKKRWSRKRGSLQVSGFRRKKKSGFERAVFLGGSLQNISRVWFQEKVVPEEGIIRSISFQKKRSGFERAVFLGGSLHCSRKGMVSEEGGVAREVHYKIFEGYGLGKRWS